MTGSLKTAFCLWLATNANSIAKAIGDSQANPNFVYPECLVTELRLDTAPVGLPRAHDRVRDSHGTVTARGKLFTEETYYRLTFTAPDDASTGTPGLSRVEAARNQVRNLIKACQISRATLVMTDIEANPAVSFTVKKIEMDSIADVPSDLFQKPFLYRCALTVKLLRTTRTEQAVLHTIQHIQPIQVTEVPHGEQ